MQVDFKKLRVAIVHEWFVDYSGSERVVEQMLNVFPDADLFSTVEFLSDDLKWFIKNKSVSTSFVQKLPFAQKKYRNYLPLMPLAVEQHDLSSYDLIISSSHAVAKGVLTGPDQLHICMCYSPIRYAWDLQHQYLRESGLNKGVKGWIAKWLLHKIRIWDYRTAAGVDEFIAISHFITKRIKKVYGRGSKVIYPPVDVEGFSFREDKDDFYFTASRMVPYKKLDLIVEAFSRMPDRQLIVVGDGPDMDKVKSKCGPNVKLLGFQPFDVLKDHMQRAKAFIFASEEDFGIAPLEAQACGTPVIAFGKGGALETIRGKGENPTGLFYPEQSVESLIEAVSEFESEKEYVRAEDCRQNALRFSPERFQKEFRNFVADKYKKFVGEKEGCNE